MSVSKTTKKIDDAFAAIEDALRESRNRENAVQVVVSYLGELESILGDYGAWGQEEIAAINARHQATAKRVVAAI